MADVDGMNLNILENEYICVDGTLYKVVTDRDGFDYSVHKNDLEEIKETLKDQK